jgi:hypothetical protein
MPTLRELFQTKILKSGQTAEQQYDIQNLKPVPVKTNSGAIDLLATPVSIARRNFPQTLSETRLEQEALGIRQIRAFSSPVLYGTAIAKLKLKQSSSVVTMKNAASTLINTDGNFTGIVNKLVDKAKEVGKGVLSKLGIQLPEAQLPTRVATKIRGQLIFSKEGSPISPDKLRQIQQASQGNGAGKILAAIGQGATGEQIKNQVLGAGINAAKKAITKAAFGAVDRVANTFKSVQGSVTPSLRPADVSYNSKRKYSKIIKIRNKEDGTVSDNGNYTTLKGLQDYINKPISIGGGLLGMLAGLTQPEGLFLMSKSVRDNLDYANPKSLIFPEFPQFSLESITQNIPNKRTTGRYGSTISPVPNVPASYNIEATKKFVTTSDLVNSSRPWYSETGDELPKLGNDKTLDDYDFIPLRFYSIAKQTGVSFKATISGLEESFSPSWDSHRFVGSPFNFYTYNSIERTLSFSFKVYSLNNLEHRSCWEKLNFLAGLTYPQNPAFEEYTTPPFIKFTLGDMYKNKEAFVESLSYSIEDTTPWDIGIYPSKTILSKTLNRVVTLEDNPGYNLPTIVNVSITIKFLENIINTAGKRLYGYNGAFSEEFHKFSPDGKAKKPEKVVAEEVKKQDAEKGGVSQNPVGFTKEEKEKLENALKDIVTTKIS